MKLSKEKNNKQILRVLLLQIILIDTASTVVLTVNVLFLLPVLSVRNSILKILDIDKRWNTTAW
jgi:hypothetical protein